MSKTQIAGIVFSILGIIFFIIVFQKHKKYNHIQDLRDEIYETREEEIKTTEQPEDNNKTK